MHPDDPRRRVVIQGLQPEIDGGRYPIKRTPGERVRVEADIFADGHDVLSCLLLVRRASCPDWQELPMAPLPNDRWQASFAIEAHEDYLYTIEAWVDRFETWRRDTERKAEAGQEVALDLLAGAQLGRDAAARAGAGRDHLLRWASRLEAATGGPEGMEAVRDEGTRALMARHADRSLATRYGRELRVTVERERARYGAWYEMFPRSCAPVPGRHGTLRDCEAGLPYVASMGFDVLYLPPIHPIGLTNRKGRNNAPTANEGDPGSPWAIGSAEGGHKSIHPQLGTLEDLRHLLDAARGHGIEIALDCAFQCSSDHPYVREHPEWFRMRPDGTVQYAENPPKKYEDIYPLNFETESRRELWEELKSTVLFWCEQGVRIFRVDNPHTKPFRFWEWLIAEVKERHPDVLFLSEAFTRPKVMYHLAKGGFSQSYTYFAWRNTKEELQRYFEELRGDGVGDYFRPNLWPNTPDILTEYLQSGGRPGFFGRLVLAATLGASYGIYGPAFELCEDRPREPGSEEYVDSEKYQIRQWDLDRPDSLREVIARVNRIRRENPALQSDQYLRFHRVDNDYLICYSKHTPDLSNIILVVVNLDPHFTHSGWLDLSLEEMGIGREPFQAHDLLSDARYVWNGPRNLVQLDPHVSPAHIFLLRRRVRSERQFEYYL